MLQTTIHECRGRDEHILSTREDRFTPDIQELKEINALPKYDREFALESNRKILRKLRESQKAWYAYRESACGAVEQTYEGGTITALVIPLCKIEITQQRTKFLVKNFGK
jgi:uncharacterized protein YecT (DUF1311 family)